MSENQNDIFIPWDEVNTILLDMDGTLLDLYFDNYFWQEYLPLKWGELNGLSLKEAKSQLEPEFKIKEGTLHWYCLDYWSAKLGVDILELKADLEHLIRTRPFADEFLIFLAGLGKTVVMVTNAHEKLIEMKLERTGIDRYFDNIFSSHALGLAKEEVAFWQRLAEKLDYAPESTLLIDDNLHVLRSARAHGIRHLFTIAQPDSRGPVRTVAEFPVIVSFETCYRSLRA